MFDKSFQSELLRKSPGNLLRNFLRHVLEMKSVKEELQQKVYKEVMRRQDEVEYDDDAGDDMMMMTTRILNYGDDNAEYYLILTLLDNTEIKIASTPLLACFTASDASVNNIKNIKARLEKISEKDWEAFYLQSVASLMDNEQMIVGYAEYSPRISEMLGSGRLTQFR